MSTVRATPLEIQEAIRIARKVGAGVDQRLFAGHEYDVADGLSYQDAAA